MRSLVPKLLTVAVVLAAALVWVPAAGAVPTFNGAFKLATGKFGTNNKIVAGSDGNVWFTVETAGKEVAKITPTGQITEYTLPEAAGATSIASGPEGRLWLTAKETAISFSPFDPEKTEEHFEVEGIGEESQIALGLRGEMWVASKDQITHFLPSDPKNVHGTFTPVGALTPKDIDSTGLGMVVADANHERLLTIGSGGNQGPDIPLGNGTMTSQGVAGSPNGQAAFSKSDGTEGLGLVSNPTSPTAVLMPGDPFGVALGPDGNYWFAMSAAHGVEQLTPTGQTSALVFPGFDKWFPRQITAGPGATLWVTMEEPVEMEYAIALVSGVTPPPVTSPPVTNPITVTEKPVPNTRFGKGPKQVVKTTGAKARVAFTFSSTVAGSSFQCRLTKMPTGKKKKAKASKGAFGGCRSPKVLKLTPGKYRFAVRAVAAGAIDGSPAEKAFRVIRAPRHR
jgi:virginiamycin B lyase